GDCRGRDPHPARPRRDARGGGVPRRRSGGGRGEGRRARRAAASRPRPARRQDAQARRDIGSRADRRAAHRRGGDPDRLQPAGPGGAGEGRRCDGLPRQAVHQGRPGARDRGGAEPVRRAQAAGVGGRGTERRAGDQEAGGPGKGRAAAPAAAERARGVPLDPEDRDGPAGVDAAGRGRCAGPRPHAHRQRRAPKRTL
ncbi:MAG: Two-component transcriptional response regulator PdtaR, LuxR family, partial [uncultured Nocardioidaceae bacterium]